MKTNKTKSILWLGAVLALGACGTAGDSELETIKRASMGKADAVLNTTLSCQDSCGDVVFDQLTRSYCGCDALCGGYGDCCDDKAQVCDAPAPCDTLDEAACTAREDCEFKWTPGFPGPIGICQDKSECFGAWLDQQGNCRGPADGVLPNECCAGQFCGGIAGIPCPAGYQCKLDGTYPDAGGTCELVVCPAVMCALYCEHGYETDEHGCDTCKCKRVPSMERCARSTGDSCTKDSDCVAGGCGGELCFNPLLSGGYSTCDCTAPAASCGCVNGKCGWWQ